MMLFCFPASVLLFSEYWAPGSDMWGLRGYYYFGEASFDSHLVKTQVLGEKQYFA